MEVTYDYITDDWAAGQAITTLSRSRMVGFDTETVGTDPTRYESRLRLVQLAPSPDHCYIFDILKLGAHGKRLLVEYLEREDIVKMAHELKFDIKQVRWHLGVKGGFSRAICTRLACIVAGCGSKEGFGLRDSCFLYTEHVIEKEEQRSDWARPELSANQLRYAALDACVLFDLWAGVREDLIKYGLLKCATLEFECVEGLAQVELNGIHLDEAQWMRLYDRVMIDWTKQRRIVQDMLMGRSGSPQVSLFSGAPSDIVNLNSPAKVIEALMGMGVPVPVNPRSENGGRTVQQVYIEPLALDYPVIREYIDYKELDKAKTCYGPAWVEKINEWTGRIHAEFNQIGARATGRMSASNPNVQQPPKDEEYRKAFTAEPGNLIVGLDYSQFELRILADLCGDETYRQVFRDGKDLHRFTASLIFEVVEALVTSEQRDMAKNNNFADVYGAGDERFALMAKIALKLAHEIKEKARAAFPVKTAWLDRTGQEAVRTLQSRTGSGRLIKYEAPASNQERAGVARNGKNTPIQGTNADVLKRAVKLVNDKLKGQSTVKMIHLVHDEMVFECPAGIAKDVEYMAHGCMVKAGEEYVKHVPVKVDGRIGPAWSK